MAETSVAELEQFKISGLPDAAYYIPNFITEEQEQEIIEQIRKLPNTRWTVLTRRRLLSLPSQLAGSARDTLIAAPMPAFLTKTMFGKMQELAIFNGSPHGLPNHCLVNEYEPGQGIMPHEDGPAYFPITATVSLASHTVLEIYKKSGDGEREIKPTWRILQEPRSLLITMGDMYKDTLHGISELEQDVELGADTVVNWRLLGNKSNYENDHVLRETRISLTYRDVLKVAKLGNALNFINKR